MKKCRISIVARIMRIKIASPEFPGVNVVPMIDTMLVLIVFFMIATKFIDIERDVRVHPPESRDARPITEALSELVINVAGDGTYTVAGKQRTIAEIDTMIAAAIKATPNQPVVVRGDKATLLQFAVNVIELCEKYGVEHTYLTTRMPDA